MSEPSTAAIVVPEPAPESPVPDAAPATEAAAFHEAVAALRAENEVQTARIHELQGHVERLERELAQAVERYREALLRAAPDLPPELVAGQTVEELDASAARARALVQRVRSQMEAEAARGRVPAGAPPRRAPDLSALTAREKIALGLDRR